MVGFQTQVGVQPAPATEGDFCDSNPRASVIAGPGGLVAGAAGLTIGRFAWWSFATIDPNGTPTIANNFGAGPPTGFIHREQQGLLINYLQESSMFIPAGFGVTLMASGGYWVKNNGAGAAQVGMKAYADLDDGRVSFAATGSPAAGGSATGSIAASTGSFTGSISNNVMTISAVGSGAVVVGGTLSGTGVATGTKVVSQLTGTPGGVGTYVVTPANQTVASTTISETYGTFTAASGLTGAFSVGSVLSGTGVDAGTTITALGTGTGGLGTYIVSSNTVVSSTAISATGNVETKWRAASAGAAGELVKITDVPIS